MKYTIDSTIALLNTKIIHLFQNPI